MGKRKDCHVECGNKFKLPETEREGEKEPKGGNVIIAKLSGGLENWLLFVSKGYTCIYIYIPEESNAAARD